MKSVYLCGPINKRTDSEAHEWRTSTEQALAGRYRFLNPMRRDYRNREEGFVREIVEADYEDIRASDIVLAMADQPSWGTAMEIHQAFTVEGKLVVAICADPRPSPWLVYHCHHLFSSLQKALDWLRKVADQPAATACGPNESQSFLPLRPRS